MNYNEMNIFEKREFVGKLTHAIANCNALFEVAKGIIIIAEENNILNRIKINPEPVIYGEKENTTERPFTLTANNV